jgi:outer membrane protein insertion porin family
LNNIIKNLYTTDFFKNVSVNLKSNILNINVIENSLVQSVEINGVKNKKLKQSFIRSINDN